MWLLKSSNFPIYGAIDTRVLPLITQQQCLRCVLTGGHSAPEIKPFIIKDTWNDRHSRHHDCN